MKERNSIDEFQKKIDKFIQNHGGYWPPLSMFTAVVEEVGELAREINHREGFKPKKPTEIKADLGEELADIIFSIICIANYYKINLNEKIYNILEKYRKRDLNRFV